MKTICGRRLKTLVFLALMLLFGPLGDVLLSRAMKHIGAVSSFRPVPLADTFFRVFTSPAIWLGIASLLVFFVSYLLVLSWADYSYVQPVSALGYGAVALLGYFFLGEMVTGLRWVGVLLICVGVFLVGQTPHNTTERA
jgi:drug/metabolite transporter (DMT)-like permease